ncbi:MAG TPA: D-alanyl-D-alanine carboxypeptidase family protein [Clostridia bacterium]|nr:D-alanyl-D-alanine carboxypeptidase family protein [Clostridia bacterium]
MKHLKVSIALSLSLCILSLPLISQATPLEVSARAAVLIEVETGRVLYEKNAHEKMPMASTTKIMTAILAIENSNLDDILTISPSASGVEGSSLYLAKGEKLTIEQLLYGLMLRSGNDAATALAEHLGESLEGFSDMMNEKAKEIGAKDTNFMNPHGLHHKDHYTTAYDLALISAYAMKNPSFREIVSTQYYKIPWEGQPWDRVLKNKNALLWDYENANGIKTGYTKASRRCLASAAIRNNMQLVSIVLDCQPWFQDSSAILDYGFAHYKMIKLFSKGDAVGSIPVEKGFEERVNLILNDDLTIPLTDEELEKIQIKVKQPTSLMAPVTSHTAVGSINIAVDNNSLISKSLFTSSTIEENTFPSNLHRIIKQWMINTWDDLVY